MNSNVQTSEGGHQNTTDESGEVKAAARRCSRRMLNSGLAEVEAACREEVGQVDVKEDLFHRVDRKAHRDG